MPDPDLDTRLKTPGTPDLPGRVGTLARLKQASLPTPLEDAPRLSRYLGGPRILFKRDDLTGIGLGGNKVRKLEFLIAAAQAQGADTLVVCGGYQSNLARIATAMANRAGLAIELVLGGSPGEPRPLKGNLLLDTLMGASVTYVETVPRWEFGDSVERVAEAVRRRGGRPFVVPLGGSGPEGMAGYIAATAEMRTQFAARNLSVDRLVVAIGSGGTYGGLLLGAANMDMDYRVTGISVSRRKDYLNEKIPESMAASARALQLATTPSGAALDIHDDYIGDDYGAMTPECAEAIRLVARLEGVLLDPVYSGKAMAGLIGLIRKGVIAPEETVVFLHTGGQTALHAVEADLLLTGRD